MNEHYAELISNLPLFKGYTPHGAERLMGRGEVKEHAAGDLLFNEGDPPKCVLLVLTGKLEVFVVRHGKDVVITSAGTGTIVGELAVLCGIPRSASVRVTEPSTVLQWEPAAFRQMLFSDIFLSEKIFRESLRTLIEKERSLIASLTSLQEGGKTSEVAG